MTYVGDSPPNTLHSIVEFTCEEGYQVEEGEDYVLACKEDGSWSSEVPHCVPIKCEISFYLVSPKLLSTEPVISRSYPTITGSIDQLRAPHPLITGSNYELHIH